MTKEVWLLAIFIVIVFLAVVVVVAIMVEAIFEWRRKKRILKLHKHWEEKLARRMQEELARPRQSVPELNMERHYIIQLCLNSNAEAYVQRAQMRTKAESPEEVAEQGLRLYIDLVEYYSQGYRLFIHKFSEKKATQMKRFKFEPLDRVEKKIES